MIRLLLICLVVCGCVDAKAFKFRGLKLKVPEIFVVSQSNVSMRGKATKGDMQFAIDVNKCPLSRSIFEEASRSKKALEKLEGMLSIGEIVSCKLVDVLDDFAYKVESNLGEKMRRLAYYIPVRGNRMVEFSLMFKGKKKDARNIAREITSSMKYTKACRCISG
ncbi:MAG: hypothetical protein P0S94_01710 [Simkaniaceae bacterium]|nr:hypothetical protein [Simkaniaceae bacterium]